MISKISRHHLHLRWRLKLVAILGVSVDENLVMYFFWLYPKVFRLVYCFGETIQRR